MPGAAESTLPSTCHTFERRSTGTDRLTDFSDSLRVRILANLNAFERRPIALADRRAAAVAITLLPDESGRACFAITRRAERLGAHAGQWAIPGGRLEAGESAETAALRELEEEVGLSCPADSVLGCLDDYATRSGYVITPVVVWGQGAGPMTPDPSEVAAAYTIPIADLDHPEVPQLSYIPQSERPVLAIPFERLGTSVNAPTAALLFQLREVAIHGRGTRVAHYEQPVFAWR